MNSEGVGAESKGRVSERQESPFIDYLVIDELGSVAFSKAGAELVLKGIRGAYEFMAMTTNLAFEEWTGSLAPNDSSICGWIGSFTDVTSGQT